MGFNLESLVPYLGATGEALRNLDENKSGGDDFAGELLVYAAEAVAAVIHNEDLPAFPDLLKAGTSDKITGTSRAILIVASSVLSIASFQVAGKARQVLKYITQALGQLLAGQTVPPPPSTLL